MHDYFQILGVPPDAAARDIRVACARHAARPHGDLLEAERRVSEALGEARGAGEGPSDLVDVAIDFPSWSPIVDRMQAAFFRVPRETSNH